MKKVWILERFYSREEDKKTLRDLEIMRDEILFSEDQEKINSFDDAISRFNKILLDYPDGHWVGFEGKTNYKDFCYCAKAAIRRNPESTFRVVKAEIEDSAKYWTGYKNVEVNEGVLKYLMATK